MSLNSVSVLTFPYHSSKTTGRGHDRYTAEVVENLLSTGDLRVNLVDQGFSKGALYAVPKLYGLARDLFRERADVYHAIAPVGGASAALLRKKPLVVTVHDLIPFQVSGFDPAWKNRYVRACTRTCIRLADALIVPLVVTKDELVSKHGADPSKIHVVNYGVDHTRFYPRPELERSTRRILCVGEVSRSKGVDVLIRAFARVKERVKDAELVVAGKSSVDQPALEELARSLGLSVSFPGFISEAELPIQYATAAIMAFPSRYGFGLSTLEAMACGTPVVAARALDAPEFIADAGLLSEPGEVEGLAENMLRILTEPGVKEHYSAKGIARAQEFSWANTARNTRRVYEHVLGR